MKLARTFVAAASAALSLSAQAVTLATDGSWAEFAHDEAGSSLYELFSQENIFTFTLAQDGILRIVDGGFSGDRFEIFANGQSLGLTSSPTIDNGSQLFDPDTAWNEGRYSQGSWSLSAGIYSITGIASASPFCGEPACGLGYLSVTAVPEPRSVAMLLAGLGCIGFMAGRRRRYS